MIGKMIGKMIVDHDLITFNWPDRREDQAREPLDLDELPAFERHVVHLQRLYRLTLTMDVDRADNEDARREDRARVAVPRNVHVR